MGYFEDPILGQGRTENWKSDGSFVRPIDRTKFLYFGDATTINQPFGGETAIFENSLGTNYNVIDTHGSGYGSILGLLKTGGTTAAPTMTIDSELLGGVWFGGMDDGGSYALRLGGGLSAFSDGDFAGGQVAMRYLFGDLLSSAGIYVYGGSPTKDGDIEFLAAGGPLAHLDFDTKKFHFGLNDESYFDETGALTARINKRVTSVATPGAEPSTNVDTTDIAEFTTLDTAITSMTTNLSGTPVSGQMLQFIFQDDGTARAIAWGASFADGGTVALPTTTVISTTLRVLVQYETIGSLNKWVCVAVS